MVHILDWNGLAKLGEFDPEYLQEDIEPEERLRIAEPGAIAPRRMSANGAGASVLGH